MKKNISNPTKKLFALLAIPAIAIFLMAFSEKEYVVKDVKEDRIHYLSVQNGAKEKNGVCLITTTRDGKVVKGQPNMLSPTNSKQQDLSFTFYNQAKDKPLYMIDGKEVSNIDNILPDEIYSITVLKDNSAISIYGEKGKNGVILITTKAFADQNPELLQQQTELEKKPQELEKLSEEHPKKTLSVSFFNDMLPNKPLYIVDGEEVSTVDNLLPEQIESISVLKENTATTTYGEKGKNGVVLITTKKSQK